LGGYPLHTLPKIGTLEDLWNRGLISLIVFIAGRSFVDNIIL